MMPPTIATLLLLLSLSYAAVLPDHGRTRETARALQTQNQNSMDEVTNKESHPLNERTRRLILERETVINSEKNEKPSDQVEYKIIGKGDDEHEKPETEAKEKGEDIESKKGSSKPNETGSPETNSKEHNATESPENNSNATESHPSKNTARPSGLNKTEMEVFHMLIDPSVYDQYEMPPHEPGQPLKVECATYVSHITGINAARSEFKIQVLIRYIWHDARLEYGKLHPNVIEIQGEEYFRQRVWYPNVYVVNEKDSKSMDVMRENILISIAPNGRVSYMFRVTLTLACGMSLGKFPFDTQICKVEMESWSIPTNKMELQWTEFNPLAMEEGFEMVDYYLRNKAVHTKTNSYLNSSLWTSRARKDSTNESNYSALEIEFTFDRKSRHYVIEYYIPMIFLVLVSWVSFWLDPNAAPARVTLGTTTLLSFITLKRNMDSGLPKVAYITAMGAWVFACMSFIFLSLVEFAFVHTIHRRSATEKIQIKKPKAKYILRAGISPMPSRRSSPTGTLKRRKSLSDIGELKAMETLPNNPQLTVPCGSTNQPSPRNALSANSLENYLCEAVKRASIRREKERRVSESSDSCESIEISVPAPRRPSDFTASIRVPKKKASKPTDIPKVEVMGIEEPGHFQKGKDAKKGKRPSRIVRWTRKRRKSLEKSKAPVEWEPQRVSRYIDQKSRIVFPITFIIFNLVYWMLVFVI